MIDALTQTKIKLLKKMLEQNGINDMFDFQVDENTGKLVITKKQKTDKFIDSRFDILDL